MCPAQSPGPERQGALKIARAIGIQRIDWWDRLRLLAFLDIVGFHIHQRHPLWGIGLPIFLLLSISLGSLHRQPPSTGNFVQARVKRILIPWVFWSIVLGVYVSVMAWRRDISLDRIFEWPMLLAGPLPHLWFLPFIFVAGNGAHLVDRATQRMPLSLFVSVAIGMTLGLLWWAPLSALGYPYVEWGFGLPAIPLALGLARILGRAASYAVARKHLLQYLAVFSALALLTATAIHAPFDSDVLRRYVIGLAAIVGCLFLPARDDPMSFHVQKLMLAMYILHVPLKQQIIPRLESIAPFIVPAGVEIALIAGASLAVAWTLRATPLRRFV